MQLCIFRSSSAFPWKLCEGRKFTSVTKTAKVGEQMKRLKPGQPVFDDIEIRIWYP
jgi:hypothetical protein